MLKNRQNPDHGSTPSPISVAIAGTVLSITLFLVVLSIIAYIKNGHIDEPDETSIYFLFFGLAPLVGGALLKFILPSAHADTQVRFHYLMIVNAIAIQFIFINSFPPVFKGNTDQFFEQTRVFLYVQVGISILIFFAARVFERFQFAWAFQLAWAKGLGNLVSLISFVGLPIAFIAVCANQYLQEIKDDHLTLRAFQIGMSVAMIAGLAGIVFKSKLKRIYEWQPPKVLSYGGILATVLVIALQFNGSLNSWDVRHFGPYIGPAMAVNAGYRPFIDVYSQYGLLVFLIPALLFKTLLPTTYSAMELISLLFNTAEFLIILAIASKLAKSRFMGILLGLFGILVYLHIDFLNPGPWGCSACGSLPSGGGMRHLPIILSLFLLISMKKDRQFTWPSILALSVACLWSVEQTVYNIALYGAFLVCRGIVNRRHFWWYIANIAKLPIIVLGTYAAYAAISKVSYGELPNVIPYIEQLFFFNSPTFFWLIVLGPKQLLFGLHVVVYFSLLSYATYVFWIRDRTARLKLWEQTEPLLLIAVAGVFHLQYFVGRSTDSALLGYSLPLFLLTGILIERGLYVWFFARPSREVNFSRLKWQSLPLWIAGAIFITLSTGVIFEATDKIGHSRYTEDPLLSPRKTIFTLMLFDHYSISQIAAHWHAQLFTNIPEPYQDEVALIEKHTQKSDRIAIFLGDDELPIFAYARRGNIFSVGHVITDSQSKTLKQRILAEARALKPGDLLLSSFSILRRNPGAPYWSSQPDQMLGPTFQAEGSKVLLSMGQELLRQIVENTKLEVVEALPNGVALFRVYSGEEIDFNDWEKLRIDYSFKPVELWTMIDKKNRG